MALHRPPTETSRGINVQHRLVPYAFRRFVLSPLLGLLLMVGALPAYANYKEIYNQALEAVKDENWPLAKALFEAAATAEPKPKNRVRLYGMKYFSYLPYFNLARANYELKNCDGALENADRALQYGVVKDSGPDLEMLSQIQSECQPNLVDEWVRERLATLGDQTRSLDGVVSKYRNENLLAELWKPGQPLSSRSDQVKQSIEALEARLGASKRISSDDFDALDTELANITTAVSDFETQARTALQEARLAWQKKQDKEKDLARIEAERQQREALVAGLRTGVDNVERLLERWPAEIAASAERRELDDLLQAYVLSGNMSVDELGDLNQRLERALGTGRAKVDQHLAEVASRPPDELVAAVNAYFKGNFQESLELLQAKSFTDGVAGYYHKLFSAAAQFQLSFSAESSERQRLMSSAQANIRSAFAIERRQLDARAFSPRFVEFANSSIN